MLYYDPIILCNEKDLRNMLHVSWANISKLCMIGYEKMDYDSKRITSKQVSLMFSRVSQQVLMQVYNI